MRRFKFNGIIISHLGNIDGRHPELENTLPYVQQALKDGWHVCVDVVFRSGGFLLPHDNGFHPAPPALLSKQHTDSENRFAPGKARVNDLVATRLDECRHDSVERSHSGNNEPVSVEGPRTVSGQGDRSTRVLKGLQRRVDIARTIVKDDDAL